MIGLAIHCSYCTTILYTIFELMNFQNHGRTCFLCWWIEFRRCVIDSSQLNRRILISDSFCKYWEYIFEKKSDSKKVPSLSPSTLMAAINSWSHAWCTTRYRRFWEGCKHGQVDHKVYIMIKGSKMHTKFYCYGIFVKVNENKFSKQQFNQFCGKKILKKYTHIF